MSALLMIVLSAAAIGGCSSVQMPLKNEETWITRGQDRLHRGQLDRPGQPGQPSPTTAPADASTQPETSDWAAAMADLDRSESLIGRRDYSPAPHLLLDLEGRLIWTRDLDRAAEAAFWLAFCDEKMELPDKAVAQYVRLIGRYPQSPQARNAADRLNRLRPTRARVAPSPLP